MKYPVGVRYKKGCRLIRGNEVGFLPAGRAEKQLGLCPPADELNFFDFNDDLPVFRSVHKFRLNLLALWLERFVAGIETARLSAVETAKKRIAADQNFSPNIVNTVQFAADRQ